MTVAARSLQLLFYGLLALFCLWMLSLPVLPTQDGPMHLYLARVFSDLLGDGHTFSSYFFIRHLVSPYVAHYYLLIAFSHIAGYIWADKLAGTLILLITALGFRFLARQLGAAAPLTSLFFLPLLINWPFFMGFFSFALATGMALWALGFWCRARSSTQPVRWLGAYLATIVIMTVTHPVPVAVVCAFAFIDAALRTFWKPQRRDTASPASAPGGNMRTWLFAVLGSLTLLYVLTFTDKRLASGLTVLSGRAVFLHKCAQLSYLSIFSGQHATTYLHRGGLYLLLIACFFAAARGFLVRLRARTHTAADAMLICGVLLAIALPILPPDLNGQAFFTARLSLVVWIALVAAASGAALPRPRICTTLAGLATVLALGTLLLAEVRLRPVAYRLLAIAAAPPVSPPGSDGLFLVTENGPTDTGLSPDPFRWVAADYFRRTGTVMLDAGFMDSPVIPVGAKWPAIASPAMQPALGSAPATGELLLHSAAFRSEIMAQTNFVFFKGLPDGDAATRGAAMLHTIHTIDRDEPSRSWNCTGYAWYFLCQSPVQRQPPVQR